MLGNYVRRSLRILAGSGKNAPVRKLIGTTMRVPRFAACLSFLANDAIIIASDIEATPAYNSYKYGKDY